MIKSFLKISVLGLLATAIAGLPLQAVAQSTNKSSAAGAEKKEPVEKKAQSAGPFRGKLAALDKSGKTITVGKRTFHITSETKIMKAGKPATLEDGVVGEEVSGGFKTGTEGKLVATKVTFGPKAEAKGAEKKKEN